MIKLKPNYSRIDDYYRIRNYQLKINKLDAESFCGLCYLPSCSHSVEKIGLQDVNRELSVWSDVALQEYNGSYIKVGEVSVYPAWPVAIESPQDHTPYRVYPIPKGAVFGGIVAHNEIHGYDKYLKPNEELVRIGRKIARFGAGMYWGYVLDNEFYVIKLFREGWIDIKRRTLPSADVTGLMVPDLDVEFEIEGYHFLPRLVTSNAQFQTKYFKL